MYNRNNFKLNKRVKNFFILNVKFKFQHSACFFNVYKNFNFLI